MLKQLTRSMVLGAALALSATACTPIQKGETVMTLKAGEPTRVVEATRDGEYRVYSLTETTPKFSAQLNRGEKYGFERADDGTYAVYGEKRQYVGHSDANYYWKYISRNRDMK